MSPMPGIDLYNGVVQTPKRAFFDPELQGGTVATNQLGLPKALGGGFAITYLLKSGNKDFAVRVFHRESKDLAERYRKISACLGGLTSQYFVKFDFQPTGIKVGTEFYPIVKMEWAKGVLLSEYLERHHSDRSKMVALRKSFQDLAMDLEKRGIAHGDIQLGNVMVNEGRVQLIDYDGMFVPQMGAGPGTELGQVHFQHPLRTASTFGPKIDRFSFIVVDLSLSAIIENSAFYKQFATTGENMLLKADDYKNPLGSKALEALGKLAQLKKYVVDFTSVCRADVIDVPSLPDFLNGKGIPVQARTSIALSPQRLVYSGALPVITANYADARSHVGDRVEAIGIVTDVRVGTSQRGGRPYIFVNFEDYRSSHFKVTLWHQACSSMRPCPDASWRGKWISVQGLVEPVYYSSRAGPSHSIEVESNTQLHVIDEQEAKFRLGKSSGTDRVAGTANQELIDRIRGNLPGSTVAPIRGGGAFGGGNRSILTNIRTSSGTNPTTAPPARQASVKTQAGSSVTTSKPASSSAPKPRTKKSKEKKGCVWVGAGFLLLMFLISMCSKK